MKKLLLLNILLLSCIFVKAQIYERYTQTNKYEYESTVQPRKIGYTTNYGKVYNTQQINPINNYSIRIRPYCVYQNRQNVYDLSGISNKFGNPKMSAQRPFSGNLLEDLADWWRIKTDSNWPGYIDDDYWEEFLNDYPEYESEARSWFEKQGMSFPTDPDDPLLDPIGNGLTCLGFMALVYSLYLRTKLKKKTEIV